MAYTKAITLLDGAMGTMLQKAGLKLGDRRDVGGAEEAHDPLPGARHAGDDGAGVRLLGRRPECGALPPA